MIEKDIQTMQASRIAKLKEAIKTCLEAGVDVCSFSGVASSVWVPPSIFKMLFSEYTVVKDEEDERLHKLIVVGNNVEYKSYEWKEE